MVPSALGILFMISSSEIWNFVSMLFEDTCNTAFFIEDQVKKYMDIVWNHLFVRMRQ